MKLLDTVLLFSLPASGKSEVRTYMASLTEEQCRRDFGMGPTLQLDDYPYVHLMHCIDDELRAHGWHDVYYQGPTRPFRDSWTIAKNHFVHFHEMVYRLMTVVCSSFNKIWYLHCNMFLVT